MDAEKFKQRLTSRIESMGGGAVFNPGISNQEIVDFEKRHALSIPESIRSILRLFNGFELTKPYLKWDRLREMELKSGSLIFIKTDSDALAFDTTKINEAEQWSIVNSVSSKKITLTVGSLLENKVWKWLEGRQGVFMGTEDFANYEGVWIFQATGCPYPVACFTEKGIANSWIEKNNLRGTLTKLPLNISIFDWATKSGLYFPRSEELENTGIQGSFSSGYLEHQHFGDPTRSGDLSSGKVWHDSDES